MAQNYEIDIKRFNGQDYDTLLPTPASHASTHQADGSDPITMQTGNYADSSVTAEKLADSAKALTFTVTLTAAGWSNNSQTVSNANFYATGYKYDIAPAPASFIAYGEAVIYCQNITVDGQATFVCQNVPAQSLTVNIGRTVAV